MLPESDDDATKSRGLRLPENGKYAEALARLLAEHPHPDGGKWNGPKMQRATGGFVNAAYFSNLLGGRIKQPGLDKLKAIAEAMNFPPRRWLEEPDAWGGSVASSDEGTIAATFGELLDRLMASMTDARTGEPLSAAEVCRRTRGKLSADEVEALRSGKFRNPDLEQVAALSEAFGVNPAYWFGRGRGAALLDSEVVEALKAEDNRALLREGSRLPPDQKDILLLLVRQMRERNGAKSAS